MSLVSGPGRGGGQHLKGAADDLTLVIDRHVEYVKSLDTVRIQHHASREQRLM